MADIINFTLPQTSSWLVDVILWLVTISGSVWLGVILFTLVLKLITLPFDYISKAKMRKNSILMEEMRPELEKLQKQYANDKVLYNQKMMALYKRNGYSMWGACLPTILTLVIFIIAITSFTNYSNYQNQKYFYDMSVSYNRVVYEGIEADNYYIVRNEDGTLVINDKDLHKIANDNGGTAIITSGNVSIEVVNDAGFYTVTTNPGYVKYKRYTSNGENGVNFNQIEWHILEDKLALNTELKLDGKTFIEYCGQTPISNELAKSFILGIQQTKSAETFRSVDARFLWVKNIWVSDSPMQSPIKATWEEFASSYEYEELNSYDKVTDADYNNLTAKLEHEKTAPNGYFILVALTALSSLFMQWITSKSQKAQMELQTVDGQGARTNKIMMWMMPIMMAIFAFMYTAAFSLYIVLSSLISVGTTFLINFIVGKKYKAIQASATKQVVRGRVYTPPKQEEKPKEKKVSKKDIIPDNDFLSGKADRKPRGRLK